MARTRALLTDGDREKLTSDEQGHNRYQAISRIRSRIADELPQDIDTLQATEPGLYANLWDVIVRSAVDSIKNPLVTHSTHTGLDPTITFAPAPSDATDCLSSTPTTGSYATLLELCDSLFELLRIDPSDGWFTITQSDRAWQGNGADSFLNQIRTPHTEHSRTVHHHGTTAWIAFANHPSITAVSLTGQPSATESAVKSLKCTLYGTSGEAFTAVDLDQLPVTFDDATAFPAWQTTVSPHAVEVTPLEVVNANHTPLLRETPFELSIRNPHYGDPDQWLHYFEGTSMYSAHSDTMEELARTLAAHDRLRCFAPDSDTTTTYQIDDLQFHETTTATSGFGSANVFMTCH